MRMTRFFPACHVGNASHSFDTNHFDRRLGGIFVPLPTDILAYVEVLGLYYVILLAGSDPVLCFLPVRCSQEMDRSRYGDINQPFFVYWLTIGSVHGVPLIRANKRTNTGSSVIDDISGHEVSWWKGLQFASIATFEAVWLQYVSVSGSGDGPEVFVVDPPVIDDLLFLFKRDAG